MSPLHFSWVPSPHVHTPSSLSPRSQGKLLSSKGAETSADVPASPAGAEGGGETQLGLCESLSSLGNANVTA